MEYALEFAADSSEVAIVMMIYAEAIAFGIAEYDVGTGGHEREFNAFVLVERGLFTALRNVDIGERKRLFVAV